MTSNFLSFELDEKSRYKIWKCWLYLMQSMTFPTQPSPKSVSFLPYHQRISNSCRILVYFQIWEKGHLFPSDRWSSKNLMTNLIFNFVIRQLIKTNTCIHKAHENVKIENSRAYFSFSSSTPFKVFSDKIGNSIKNLKLTWTHHYHP